MKKIVKGDVRERLKNWSPPVSSLGHGGVVTQSQLSAAKKAEHIIEEAKQQAESIIKEAERILSQVQAETEAAKQKGFTAGKEEGLAEVTEEVIRARVLKEKFYEENEAEILRLVVAVAEKVIGETVHQYKEACQAVVRQALERTLGDRIVVRINPADIARVQEVDKSRPVHFKGDNSITVGGCIVETEVGTIDAQLETQLKAIKKALGV